MTWPTTRREHASPQYAPHALAAASATLRGGESWGIPIGQRMKATLNGRLIAESDDIVENGGYAYFPSSAVRLEWLVKGPQTDSDRACPHGVQFYDIVIDGVRHPRAAWVYEAPRPDKAQIAGRFSFWEVVEVG